MTAHIAARLGNGADAPAELAARVAHIAGGAEPPAGVFAPDSADGIAAVLGMCAEEGWPVRPIGAGTWLPFPYGGVSDEAAWSGHGATGTDDAAAHLDLDPRSSRAGADVRPPILVSTVRLERIVEHEPADLVIGVEAGIPLQRLAAELRRQGQWLPLDPPAASEATIGAIAARADAGPLRAGHGTPRDMLLGVELATGDGRLLRFGGRVVKNVAGYDGVRLAVGSRGRLGVITRLYLRVRGAPRVDRTLAVACGPGRDGLVRAADLALALRTGVSPDALEVLAPRVARALNGQRGESGWLVLVRILGSEAAVSDGMSRAERLSRSASRGVAEVPSVIWDALARIEGSAAHALTLTGRPMDLAAGLQVAAEWNVDGDAASDGRPIGAAAGDSTASAHSGGGGWFVAAHGSNGLVRAWRGSGDGVQLTHTTRSALSPNAGWTLRYDRHDAARGKVDPGSRGPDASAAAALAGLTRRLTSVFDPAGILNGEAEEN